MNQVPVKTARSPFALRCGRVAGIDVYVHATFLALLVLLGGARLAVEGSVERALREVLFIVTLFVCVVLHELGHALVARRYGIGTRDITLYPFGGIATLDRVPTKPREEIAVAISGPLVNLAIAALLALALPSAVKLEALGGWTGAETSFFAQLIVVNVFLAAFNLLPAFPMDGGRVLRAALASRMERARATRWAATIGQGMAALFAVLALLGGGFMLFVVAIFVWVAAAAESRAVTVRAAIDVLQVSAAMETRIVWLAPDLSLDQARKLLLSGPQVDFPVVSSDGRLVGMLDREALLAGLTHYGPEGLVGWATEREVPTAGPSEPLAAALDAMVRADRRSMPVIDSERRLLGMLTEDNISELIMVGRPRDALTAHCVAVAALVVSCSAQPAAESPTADPEARPGVVSTTTTGSAPRAEAGATDEIAPLPPVAAAVALEEPPVVPDPPQRPTTTAPPTGPECDRGALFRAVLEPGKPAKTREPVSFGELIAPSCPSAALSVDPDPDPPADAYPGTKTMYAWVLAIDWW